MLLGGNNREAQIIQGLIARGMAPHIAQGFTANMIAESGLNPGINEINPVVPGSRGGFGLNQWTGPRRRAYEAFAAERGRPLDDLDTQLDFTMFELQGPEASAWRSIQGAQDPVEAARLVSERFLRPGIPHLDRRLSEAARLGGMQLPAPTVSTSGGAAMNGLLGGAQPAMPQQPEPRRGLLDRTLRDEDWRARAAIALEGMTLNPNVGLMNMLGGEMQDRRETKKQEADRNRTMEYLEGLGTPQAAEALRYAQGTGDIAGALKMALQTPQGPEIREVGGRLVQVSPDGQVAEIYAPQADARGRVVDASELRQMFPEAQIEDGLYNLKADGTATKVGGSGTNITTNVDLPGVEAFEDAFAKGDATAIRTIEDSGMQAMRNMGRIDRLEELLTRAPSGAEGVIKSIAGEFGIATEGLSDIQAAQSLINTLVPEQRQPGSGPMSDADLALFKQSLPRIINQPGGNQLIVDTMRSIAQYDAEGAEIVQRLRAREIDRAQAFQMLQSRQNPLATFRAPAGAPATDAPAPTSTQPRVRVFNPATGQLE
jgi:hypothetical protein